MNFKEFIKFTWRKVLISVSIILLTLLFIFISSFFFTFGNNQQPFIYYFFEGIAYALVLPLFFSLQMADLFIGTGVDYVIIIVGVILSPVYIYFLSCLVNLLIEKIKTKSH